MLSCDDGQEENLKELASHLDSKYAGLKKNLGNIGENKLLLITSIMPPETKYLCLLLVPSENSKKPGRILLMQGA